MSPLLLLACSTPAPRPNVLLLTLDTTRRDAIGAYGGTSGATPTIDGLAAEGVRFDRAYTVTPLTIPAHSSVHTGMYPPRHGVRDNGDFFLGEGSTTLAERLTEAGYRTMASVGAEVTSHHWGFNQGFSAYFDDMGPADPDGNRWRVERPGDQVVNDAIGWLDKNGTDAPWFAWVHMFDAHHPYEPPPPYDVMFEGKPYAGEIAFMDDQVKRLRAWLEAHEQLDHTWIVVVADHGEGLGSHGEQLHGTLLYDATTHLPYIIRPPTGTPGVVDTPVSLVDLAPTILGIVGAAPLGGIDGQDLRPFMAGKAPEDRAVYAESRYAFHHYGWAPQTALITPTHKLIDSTTDELYAAGDKLERVNLATTMPSLLEKTNERLATLSATLVPAPGATRADLSPERVSQLEALGYLTTGADVAPTDGLPDPVRQLPVLAKLEAARAAMRSTDINAAALALDAALAADPALVETRLLKAQLLMRQNKGSEALDLLRAIDAERPSSRSKAMIGSTLVGQGKAKEGAEILAEAIAIDPYQAGMWTSYLRALLLAGDPRLGAEAQRGLTLLPDTPAIIGMKGLAFAMQERWALAEPLLDEALAREPNQPFLSHALGMVYKARGDVIKAEPMFEEEIRMFPPALPSRRMLVELYAAQKRYDEQLVQLEVIKANEPPLVDTMHSLAQVLFNLKRYPESMKALEECRAFAPGYAGCAMLEANALKKLGRDADAQAAYERALELGKKPL